MNSWRTHKYATFAGVLAIVAAALTLVTPPTVAQAPAAGMPRTAGKPNFSGIWQSINEANWDILAHKASQGPVISLGAAFSVPGGIGVVEGNEIPYKPAALAKKRENAAQWMTLDPEVKCYMAGTPRATYQPFPFQIVQSGPNNDMLISYEFAMAARIVRMNMKEEGPVDSWMGWSRGRWEGDTLVVDVTGFNGQAWFDRAGNFQSDTLHVVERYTPLGKDAFRYDVTIEDPTLYTRPWKMSMPIYRRLEKDAQLVEYHCVEFAEPLVYGHLVRQR